PLPVPLHEFIREGNAELSRPHYDDTDFDKLTLLFLLADAHTQLGEWKEAEPLFLRVATAPRPTIDDGFISDPMFRVLSGSNLKLAGIYARQNQGRKAARYYFYYQRLFYLHYVLPVVALCLGFLALWHWGEKARSAPPMAPAVKKRLVLCCFFPLFFAL